MEASDFDWPAVLVRVDLHADAKAGYFNFKAPLPLYPEVAQFDCDAQSEEFLVSQLTQSLAKAPAAVLWISSDGIRPLGAAAVLMEALLRHSGPVLLLLQGKHPTLERMGRRLVATNSFKQAEEEAELLQAAQEFFASVSGSNSKESASR